MRAYKTLGELIPGLADLPGYPMHEDIGGPLLRHLEAQKNVSWAHLATMRANEIRSLQGMGPVRTEKVLEAVSGRVPKTAPVDHDPPADVQLESSSASDAVAEIAAWAHGSGRGGTLLDAIVSAAKSEAFDVPEAAVRALENMLVGDLADERRADSYDPLVVAEQVLNTFDDRERATLERILAVDNSAPTLVELGERFGVTSERIRQIELCVQSRLTGLQKNQALASAADQLSERLGSAVPIVDLRGILASFPPDETDRLILHLAGPYRQDEDWLVLEELVPLDDQVQEVFDQVAEDGTAPLARFTDELRKLGIREEHHASVMDDHAKLKVIGETVVDWSGSMADKGVISLELENRPMTLDEIAAVVEPNSLRSMSGQVRSDDRIVRTGVKTYALAKWDQDEFAGILSTMTQRLSDGPRLIDELAHELAGEFNASTTSIRMYSETHPAFISELGSVRLRTANEPYVPKYTLEESARCYLIDGVWAWRREVDAALLRGSGMATPEAFAQHLGCEPLGTTSIESPYGPVSVGWHQTGTLGSLRAAACDLGATEGDWLFVRRVTPSSLDFRIQRAADLPADPEGRLRCMVGAPKSTAHIERVIADAIGLCATTNQNLSAERTMLTRRRAKDLIKLLDSIGDERVA